MIEFRAWPKTPRLFRPAVVTEKIDGTNGAIIIEKVEAGESTVYNPASMVEVAGAWFLVAAQSRSRVISEIADNHGLAAWVYANAETLVADLGPGRHFGEWWGNGINRGYGLPRGDKRFSLFNTKKWDCVDFQTPKLGVVPIIDVGRFTTGLATRALARLIGGGSLAAPGYMNPEGVCVYHTASGHIYKATIDGDGAGKGAELVGVS